MAVGDSMMATEAPAARRRRLVAEAQPGAVLF